MNFALNTVAFAVRERRMDERARDERADDERDERS